MTPGQFLQPDHARGDANTVGGYMAAHSRPPAFEGRDGFSYSVDILAEQTGERTWSAFFIFVKWARVGAQAPQGHLETDYLVSAHTEAGALALAGEYTLRDVHAALDRLIEVAGTPSRRWWDVARDDTETE